jgi:hypothetical protein
VQTIYARRADEMKLQGTCRLLATAGLMWAACGGCSIYRMLSGTQTQAEYAQRVEPRCAAFRDTEAANLLSPSAVEGVEPAYSYVQSGSDRRANLSGARIHVRPLPGTSPEGLTRDLECHQAHAVLVGAQPRDDDPYILPGQWVDLEVSSERDGFAAARPPPMTSARSADEAPCLLIFREKRECAQNRITRIRASFFTKA